MELNLVVVGLCVYVGMGWEEVCACVHKHQCMLKMLPKLREKKNDPDTILDHRLRKKKQRTAQNSPGEGGSGMCMRQTFTVTNK